MTSTADAVGYELRDNGVAVLTLNRPDRLNAWGMDLAVPFYRLIDEADADEAVRVIVVTGAGRGFCAGADLREHLFTLAPQHHSRRGLCRTRSRQPRPAADVTHRGVQVPHRRAQIGGRRDRQIDPWARVARQAPGTMDLRGPMDPPQALERRVVEALHAEGQPVHTGFAVTLETVELRRAGKRPEHTGHRLAAVVPGEPEFAVAGVETESRRVGGATLQVPVEVNPYRQESLAMRWRV